MTTIRQYSKAPPDRANELFEKLLATSDSAIKSRERLFADLKTELELLATLQEDHLFPVLTRHGMQDLVREATSDNAKTAALLGELDGMSKSSSEFINKVAELRRIFQQHIRDDRKELLPAVLKVLSEEEILAVAEKVEDEMATIDETKLAQARQTREQAEVVQRVSDGVTGTLRAGLDNAQSIARVMQEAMQKSFSTLTDLAHQSIGPLNLTNRSDGNARAATEEMADNFRAVAQSGSALARGLQDMSREVADRSQKRIQRNLEGLQALAHCRSITDLFEVQSSLLRDNLEQTIENSRRIAELTIQIADEARQPAAVQAEKTVQRFDRAA
ncbi:phasin family protein [Microvirga zambiensis]|uniref:phasin family protein n=1 Tax=Microvirga zambiensis TaxID=1402137 RepID=UPI00191F666A|nr:phasin family protein [Microvirga zambiensis]